MQDPKNYTEAFNELQVIVREMESGAITVDVLAEKVKRATLLINYCREHLRNTEEDVNKILEELKEE